MDSGTRCLQKHEYRNPEPVGKLSPYNHFLVVVVAAVMMLVEAELVFTTNNNTGFFPRFYSDIVIMDNIFPKCFQESLQEMIHLFFLKEFVQLYRIFIKYVRNCIFKRNILLVGKRYFSTYIPTCIQCTSHETGGQFYCSL